MLERVNENDHDRCGNDPEHHPMVYAVQTRRSFYARCDECGWEGPARWTAKMAGQDAIAHADR